MLQKPRRRGSLRKSVRFNEQIEDETIITSKICALTLGDFPKVFFVESMLLNSFKFSISKKENLILRFSSNKPCQLYISKEISTKMSREENDIVYSDVQEINKFIQLTDGDWYIRVVHDTPSSLATCYISIDIGNGLQVANVSSKKYAILLGISDYRYINDLSFCDDDVVRWHEYLSEKDYNIVLLGDKTSSYGALSLDDYGTESNLRKHMSIISSKITPGDTFVFISSGHGNGDGRGNSYICCLDSSWSSNGKYTDRELAEDISKFVNNGANIICFFDNCYSGGMLNEVVNLKPSNVCAISTCKNDGYGFDVTKLSHGAWTHEFLIQTLMRTSYQNLGKVFDVAKRGYPYRSKNTPQIMGNHDLFF